MASSNIYLARKINKSEFDFNKEKVYKIDTEISWKSIETIGEDVILVKII